MRLLISLAFFLFVSCAPAVFAQTVDVSGKYEGTADLQGAGKIKVSAEIRQKDGKVSGVLNTPFGDAALEWILDYPKNK